jgi:hypothetical protein
MTQTITVTIAYAKGLRDADWIPGFGKSDPYCVVGIRGKEHTKFETKALNNTSDPEWNQTAEIGDYTHGDVLEMSIWDKDPGKPDDLLGEAALLPSVLGRGSFDGGVVFTSGQGYIRLKVAVGGAIAAPTYMVAEPVAAAPTVFSFAAAAAPAVVSSAEVPIVTQASPAGEAVVTSITSPRGANTVEAVYVSPTAATTAVAEAAGETVVQELPAASSGSPTSGKKEKKKKSSKKKKVAEVTKSKKFCCI